jgi:hypothetical protein
MDTDDVPDLSGNMLIDYSIFAVDEPEAPQ